MPYIQGKYFTDAEVNQAMNSLPSYEREEFREMIREKSSSGSGLLSAAIGFATGSSVVGGLLGGSFTGGLLGDLAEGTDDSIF